MHPADLPGPGAPTPKMLLAASSLKYKALNRVDHYKIKIVETPRGKNSRSRSDESSLKAMRFQ
jgi:hypothetical protein